jgi:hypothetical protein
MGEEAYSPIRLRNAKVSVAELNALRIVPDSVSSSKHVKGSILSRCDVWRNAQEEPKTNPLRREDSFVREAL